MKDEKYRIVITAKEIRGSCPVFKPGDKIVIESPKIIVAETDNICIHALGCMLSMLVPLSRGISFKSLGLAKEENETGYMQCPDPGKPYTNGGTVIFQIKREKQTTNNAPGGIQPLIYRQSFHPSILRLLPCSIMSWDNECRVYAFKWDDVIWKEHEESITL